MQGDIAFAGFMMTAEEWQALDAPSRALLMAIASRPDDRWVVAGVGEIAAEPAVERETPVLADGSGSIRRR